MSTIVYKDGIIAGDTAVNYGDQPSGNLTKIGRSKHYLFGYVGEVSGMLPYFNWVLNCEADFEEVGGPIAWYNRADELGVKHDCGYCIVATRGGRAWCIGDDGVAVTPIPRGWEAIGSGAPYATAAILCDKTPMQAVEIAMQLDNNTGGEVNYLTFDSGGGGEIITPGRLLP